MRSGARAITVSWTRSATPGVSRTRCRRRGNTGSSPRKRGPIRRGLSFWHSVSCRLQQQSLVVMGPRVRGDDEKALIPPLGVDDVVERAAGLKTFDLARHVFRYFVGIGIGGVV